MSPQSSAQDAQSGGFQGQIPPLEPLVTEIVATLTLAAHAYLSDDSGREPDIAGAETAIDIATAAFERAKERLRPEERLALAQMLTETRMTFVRKRGL